MMLKQEIKISTLWLDDTDDVIQFEIEATNGVTTTSVEFYGCQDEFKEFANKLCSFPESIDTEVKYEHPTTYAYLLLRVFCYEKNGHTAIQIKMDNDRIEPYKSYSEFYILTVPASINQLGQQLKSWKPEMNNKIEWTAE